MHATDILAYIFNGELLCAEHGEEFDNGDDDGASPIFVDGNWEFAGIEYCSHGRRGHNFCMACGSGIDDGDVQGHFAQCWNCKTETVYVDGSGYDRTAGGWVDVLESHNVEFYVSPEVMPRPMTDQNNYVKVTTVLDDSCGPIAGLRAFMAYLQHSPVSGCVLILANSWEEALYAADDYFEERADVSDDDELADLRADVMCTETLLNQVWFTTKR
jgi:hypothetical protein